MTHPRLAASCRTVGAILLTTALLLGGPWATASGGSLFDGRREGPVLAVGLGGGLASHQLEFEGGGIQLATSRQENAALVTDLSIGIGIDPRTVLGLSLRPVVFTFENFLGDDLTIRSGTGTLTLSKYSRPWPPSWYLKGGAGFSFWDLRSDRVDDSTWWGLGALLAVGREYGDHLAGELGVGWALPGREESGLLAEADVIALHLLVVARWY